jgi:3-oxoadipate enol-lactonase
MLHALCSIPLLPNPHLPPQFLKKKIQRAECSKLWQTMILNRVPGIFGLSRFKRRAFRVTCTHYIFTSSTTATVPRNILPDQHRWKVKSQTFKFLMMEFVKINGINLAVEIKGEGNPLILVHGVGGNHEKLRDLTDPLSEKFKTIAMDCRGHGKSDKPEKYTLQDHVNDVLGIIDHYKIQKAYVLGISMGSYISQGVAIAAPERVEKLVLTVPKSNGLTSSVKRLIEKHAEELSGTNIKESIPALFKYMVYNEEAMKPRLHLFETDLSPEQFAAANQALAHFDFRKDLPKVQAETLVVSGKYDGLNAPEEGKECAALIPNASFVEMQYSGHAPMLEEHDTYMKLVEDFLLN